MEKNFEIEKIRFGRFCIDFVQIFLLSFPVNFTFPVTNDFHFLKKTFMYSKKGERHKGENVRNRDFHFEIRFGKY